MASLHDASPPPASHIKTLMCIGYDLSTAVSDILDNSITADATQITINCLSKKDGVELEIGDDGYGMSEEELIANMRISCRDPEDSGEDGDLGRFGSGLKTASFSQARKLTVITKKRGADRAAAFWDVDLIIANNTWDLNVLDDSEIETIIGDKFKNIDDQGTHVIWQRFNSQLVEDFHREDPEDFIEGIVDSLHEHLGLHFHKFIEKKKPCLFINNRAIEAIDPFMKTVPQYQEAGEEKTPVKLANGKNGVLKVVAHVLPPLTSLSTDIVRRYGGEDKIREGQGFYIYRENRLIVAGGWRGVRPRNGLDALARIEVLISRDFDSAWGTDVKKGSFQIPKKIEQHLKRYAGTSSQRSRKAHNYRGLQALDQDYWEEFMHEKDGWVRFQVKRDNTELQAILSECSLETRRKLVHYLVDVGINLPTQSIHTHLLGSQQKVKQSSGTDELAENFMSYLEGQQPNE